MRRATPRRGRRLALLLFAVQLATSDVVFEARRAAPSECREKGRPHRPREHPRAAHVNLLAGLSTRRAEHDGEDDDADVDDLIDQVEGELYSNAGPGRRTAASKNVRAPKGRGRTLEELLNANSAGVEARPAVEDSRGEEQTTRAKSARRDGRAQKLNCGSNCQDGSGGRLGEDDAGGDEDGGNRPERGAPLASENRENRSRETCASMLPKKSFRDAFVAKGGWNPANLARIGEESQGEEEHEALCPVSASSDGDSLSRLPSSSSVSAGSTARHYRSRGAGGARHHESASDRDSFADGSSLSTDSTTAGRAVAERGRAADRKRARAAQTLAGWGEAAAFLRDDDSTSSSTTAAAGPCAAGALVVMGGAGGRHQASQRSLARASSSGPLLAGAQDASGKALMLQGGQAVVDYNEQFLMQLEAADHQPVLEKGVGDAHSQTPHHLTDYTRLVAGEGVYEAAAFRRDKADLKPDVLAASGTLVLEGAEQMAQQYLDEAEQRADIPNQQADDGLPEMMLARKRGAVEDWVYGGVIPAGDKKLNDVVEMLQGEPDDEAEEAAALGQAVRGSIGATSGLSQPSQPSVAAARGNRPLYAGTSYYALQRNAHAQLYGKDAWGEEHKVGCLEEPKPTEKHQDGRLNLNPLPLPDADTPALAAESFRDRKLRLALAAQAGAQAGAASHGVMTATGGASSVGAVGGRRRTKATDDAAAWQPPLASDEKDLVVVWKNTSIASRSGASFRWSNLVPMVVPREQLRAHGGEAYAHLVADAPPVSSKALLAHKDAAGNTVRSLMLSSQKQTRTLALARAKKAAAIVPAEKSRAQKMVARLARTALLESRLTPLQMVEKYRPRVEELGQMQMTGAARQTALIARAARKSKGRTISASVLTPRGRDLLERGKAVPKNHFIPRADYRRMSAKLQKKYHKAKAQAREQGDEITPQLVKAREALRFMAGTRNDVIATGARFGKRAEYTEVRKREDRSRGRRRAPHGFMHRSRGGT